MEPRLPLAGTTLTQSVLPLGWEDRGEVSYRLLKGLSKAIDSGACQEYIGAMATDEQFEQERKQCLDQILASDSPRKLIIAGPGTGKTHTFKALINQNPGKNLVMTFINNLVRDLRDDLGEVADVNTFHGYSKHLLHKFGAPGISTKVHYYPYLTKLMAEDLTLIEGSETTPGIIDAAFLDMDDSKGVIGKATRIGDYYDAVSHNDSVYRVVKAFEQKPILIPEYTQIVVDEYQDFSLLEVSLLKLLGNKSPILIAGDDDQALYGFRHASAQYIRSLAADSSYQRFELPYCTRCTAVIVDATHTTIQKAQAIGLLGDRIDKPYICYLPTKRFDSTENPHIIHAECTVQTKNAPLMAKYIGQKIGEISAADIKESHDKKHPTVLIIGPSYITKMMAEYLVGLYPQLKIKAGEKQRIELIDGYKYLMDNPNSRLGWRIVVELFPLNGWEALLRSAVIEGEELADLLPEAYKKDHLENIALLEELKANGTLPEPALVHLEEVLGIARDQIIHALEEDTENEREEHEEEDRTKPTITATSLLGSKGLQACHVFIVGLNEGHFPNANNAPSEDEVCQLLVALTRTKKRCYLLSTGRLGATKVNPSVFLDWLKPLTTKETVNAASFK